MFSELTAKLARIFKNRRIKLINIIKYRSIYYLTWVEDNRDDPENRSKNKKEKKEVPYGWDHFMLRVDLDELEKIVLSNAPMHSPQELGVALGINTVIKNGVTRNIMKKQEQTVGI